MPRGWEGPSSGRHVRSSNLPDQNVSRETFWSGRGRKSSKASGSGRPLGACERAESLPLARAGPTPFRWHDGRIRQFCNVNFTRLCEGVPSALTKYLQALSLTCQIIRPQRKRPACPLWRELAPKAQPPRKRSGPRTAWG